MDYSYPKPNMVIMSWLVEPKVMRKMQKEYIMTLG